MHGIGPAVAHTQRSRPSRKTRLGTRHKQLAAFSRATERKRTALLVGEVSEASGLPACRRNAGRARSPRRFDRVRWRHASLAPAPWRWWQPSRLPPRCSRRRPHRRCCAPLARTTTMQDRASHAPTAARAPTRRSTNGARVGPSRSAAARHAQWAPAPRACTSPSLARRPLTGSASTVTRARRARGPPSSARTPATASASRALCARLGSTQ